MKARERVRERSSWGPGLAFHTSELPLARGCAVWAGSKAHCSGGQRRAKSRPHLSDAAPDAVRHNNYHKAPCEPIVANGTLAIVGCLGRPPESEARCDEELLVSKPAFGSLVRLPEGTSRDRVPNGPPALWAALADPQNASLALLGTFFLPRPPPLAALSGPLLSNLTLLRLFLTIVKVSAVG